MPKSEVERFLEDTESNPAKVDVLEQSLTSDASPEKAAEDDEGEDDGLKPRNRRERRLMERLGKERESSMFLAGKLAAREEAKQSLSEEADYLKSVERIYGTDSPEAALATDLLKKAITGARDDAEQRAYNRIVKERESEAKETADAESELDTMIEELEDEHGVTLSAAQQKSFFQLLEKMSPKKDGVVVDYADPNAVWEVFSERMNRRPDTRAKDLASRSMVSSGSSSESKLPDESAQRFLREQGII